MRQGGWLRQQGHYCTPSVRQNWSFKQHCSLVLCSSTVPLPLTPLVLSPMLLSLTAALHQTGEQVSKCPCAETATAQRQSILLCQSLDQATPLPSFNPCPS